MFNYCYAMFIVIIKSSLSLVFIIITGLQVMQNLPKKHQTLLFSATMPVEIEELAQVGFQ